MKKALSIIMASALALASFSSFSYVTGVEKGDNSQIELTAIRAVHVTEAIGGVKEYSPIAATERGFQDEDPIYLATTVVVKNIEKNTALKDIMNKDVKVVVGSPDIDLQYSKFTTPILISHFYSGISETMYANVGAVLPVANVLNYEKDKNEVDWTFRGYEMNDFGRANASGELLLSAKLDGSKIAIPALRLRDGSVKVLIGNDTYNYEKKAPAELAYTMIIVGVTKANPDLKATGEFYARIMISGAEKFSDYTWYYVDKYGEAYYEWPHPDTNIARDSFVASVASRNNWVIDRDYIRVNVEKLEIEDAYNVYRYDFPISGILVPQPAIYLGEYGKDRGALVGHALPARYDNATKYTDFGVTDLYTAGGVTQVDGYVAFDRDGKPIGSKKKIPTTSAIYLENATVWGPAYYGHYDYNLDGGMTVDFPQYTNNVPKSNVLVKTEDTVTGGWTFEGTWPTTGAVDTEVRVIDNAKALAAYDGFPLALLDSMGIKLVPLAKSDLLLSAGPAYTVGDPLDPASTLWADIVSGAATTQNKIYYYQDTDGKKYVVAYGDINVTPAQLNGQLVDGIKNYQFFGFTGASATGALTMPHMAGNVFPAAGYRVDNFDKTLDLLDAFVMQPGGGTPAAIPGLTAPAASPIFTTLTQAQIMAAIYDGRYGNAVLTRGVDYDSVAVYNSKTKSTVIRVVPKVSGAKAATMKVVQTVAGVDQYAMGNTGWIVTLPNLDQTSELYYYDDPTLYTTAPQMYTGNAAYVPSAQPLTPKAFDGYVINNTYTTSVDVTGTEYNKGLSVKFTKHIEDGYPATQMFTEKNVRDLVVRIEEKNPTTGVKRVVEGVWAGIPEKDWPTGVEFKWDIADDGLGIIIVPIDYETTSAWWASGNNAFRTVYFDYTLAGSGYVTGNPGKDLVNRNGIVIYTICDDGDAPMISISTERTYFDSTNGNSICFFDAKSEFYGFRGTRVYRSNDDNLSYSLYNGTHVPDSKNMIKAVKFFGLDASFNTIFKVTDDDFEAKGAAAVYSEDIKGEFKYGTLVIPPVDVEEATNDDDITDTTDDTDDTDTDTTDTTDDDTAPVVPKTGDANGNIAIALAASAILAVAGLAFVMRKVR